MVDNFIKRIHFHIVTGILMLTACVTTVSGSCTAPFIEWNGSCYIFQVSTSNQVTWDIAASVCFTYTSSKGSLVTILSSEEQEFIHTYVRLLNPSMHAWIRMHKVHADEPSTSTSSSSTLPPTSTVFSSSTKSSSTTASEGDKSPPDDPGCCNAGQVVGLTFLFLGIIGLILGTVYIVQRLCSGRGLPFISTPDGAPPRQPPDVLDKPVIPRNNSITNPNYEDVSFS